MNPENYFLSTEPNEEICVVDEYQKRGTSFPVAVRTNGHFEHCFALMDTGASRSCISYKMFLKIKKPKWSSKSIPRVCTADGSDLGSLGRIDLQLKLGDREVIQDFVVCRQLKCDIILGADFGKNNCAGVEWTAQRTRVLSLNGIPAIEVEENELGLPVTAAFHVKVPPRHNGVFQVNIHGDTNGAHIISANSQFLEKNPNVYQHEISIISDNVSQPFPLIAVTNLDFAKMLHIGKGEIIGFARPESEEVMYIATSDQIDMDPCIDNAPRNWIPPRKRKTLQRPCETFDSSRKSTQCPSEKDQLQHSEDRLYDKSRESNLQQSTHANMMKVKAKELGDKKSIDQLLDESRNREASVISDDVEAKYRHPEDMFSNRLYDESTESKHLESWDEIQEVIESDFLISPGDIYPSRKIELQDAEISKETMEKFEVLCEEQHEAFSKNNQDIGKTQLIEMEIDTGGSVPLAQSPYTLPLKHYDWVRKEIETLEKAGVIERSLSPWASPVIVVPKKSAPDEPPRRQLCIDYRRVNALQQEIKRTDKSTGCLTLYPLPKIDEMFAKLGGAKIFSTIDLRSTYYHIGLTRESQAKSAFVVPMGKWQFKRTPFGLSQAPAYFQLLIDQVLMGCGEFAMGYLDDIIVFSKSEEEHLHHLEEIFKRLRHFDLKMKRQKSSFFKKHIQYLGHLVSEQGFEPLPEKLEAIRTMPHPKSPKEVKQFLGLIGYYRKFIPRFSDLSRPLTRLTRHDAKFEWDQQCQKSFDHLRELLMQYPILRYPDPKKGYTVFTDASGIGWSGVLTQEYSDEKGRVKNHPICYVSGQFRGSQLNWAALTKEAYAIYMSIRRLVFYVADADVTIKCDHLPLKKFFTKQTLNSKVNNWAVELEQFNLKLDWIMGSKNTLADTLSRLLDVCPKAKLEPEPPGQEFGCYCFEEMKPIEVDYIEEIETVQIQESENLKEIKLPLKGWQMELLQKHDSTCREIAKKLRQDKHMNKLFLLKNSIVYRLWCEDGRTSDCIVVPEVLRGPLLMLAHNYSGHNGFRRTYNAMKRQYYWPGMRKDILRHCKGCYQCALQNQGTGEAGFDHFKVPALPMEFICMDLVGPISPQTSRGNKYMLTVIDMLTGYTIAVPIMDKRSETVCKAYRDSVYCIFGGSSRILTDNGTEFKSREMKQICEDLDIKQVFSPVYTPQANGRLEGWHRFLKACIAKHIRGADVEWDELIPLAVSAYNFFPCQSSKESPFVLMFGRDPITPIAKLLEPKLKFYGEKGTGVNMDTLRKLYTVAAENIRKAREKQPRQETPPPKLKVNDLVLVKDPESVAFDPKYMPNYRTTAVYGRNRIEVQDEKGNKSIRRAAHVKICEPTSKVIAQLPPQSVYEQYGRTSKLLIHPKDVPEIPLELFSGRPETEEVDTSDESKNHEKSGVEVNEQLDVNSDVMPLTDSMFTINDTLDESRNREQYGLHTENGKESLEVNMLTEITDAGIDSSDESKNRPGVTILEVDGGRMKTVVADSHIQGDSDSNDALQTRTFRSTLTMKLTSRSSKTIIDVTNMGDQDQERTKKSWMEKSTMPDPSDNSTSRDNRCSVSSPQQPEQPVTPAMQSGSIDTTVVNKRDIDECCVTNKCECSKQDSKQMSNQWLSNTFSMITSGILGKSKIEKGKVLTENVDVNSNTKLVFKPEFNFFL